jgi:predicted GIY-YIG superfamily endonuclease
MENKCKLFKEGFIGFGLDITPDLAFQIINKLIAEEEKSELLHPLPPPSPLHSTISIPDTNPFEKFAYRDDDVGEDTISHTETSIDDDDDDDIVIYAIRCRDYTYYIGKSTTKNIRNRIAAHKRGKGSAWTVKNGFEEVLFVKENCSKHDELKYTLEFMDRYGIDKVRGAQYTQIHLCERDVEEIKRHLVSANDECFNCGGNHLASFCPNKRKTSSTTATVPCTRCGFSNHSIETCSAKRHRNGKSLL